MPDDYTTKTRVKGYLGIEDSNVDFDTELDQIIAGVSSLFDQVAGRSFTQESVTEFHNGSAVFGPIPLNQIPSEDSDDRDAMIVTDSDTVLVKDTDYFLGVHPAQTLFKLDGDGNQGAFSFTPGTRNIQVEFLTEFKVLPEDVALAATEESARRFKLLNTSSAAGDNRIGVVSVSPEVGTGLSFSSDDLSPATIRTLNSYRLRRFV